MRILIIGQGGREHAIAWKLSLSDRVSHVFVCPGNGGTALEDNITNVNIDEKHHSDLIKFAKEEHIDLTIVGPEAPLVDGLVNSFQDANLNIFGPTKEFSILEGSKAFSKKFMKDNAISTADFQEFSDIHKAEKFCQSTTFPKVLKADGLAAGKGVIICQNLDEALTALNELFNSKSHSKVVIEDFIVGQELSAIYICNFRGPTYEICLPWTKDYKSRDEYNSGPNTGGMGAVSHPILENHKNTIFKNHIAIEKLLSKTIVAINDIMKRTKQNYVGFLYLGLMITKRDIKILEYNCRSGDPETQNLMMNLHNNEIDLLDLIENNPLSKTRDLNIIDIDSKKNYVCTIVLAAKGYPGNYEKDFFLDISQVNQSKSLKIFHSGTKLINKKIKSIGGRILSINTYSENKDECIRLAYENIKKIRVFKDEEMTDEDSGLVFFREDIGQ